MPRVYFWNAEHLSTNADVLAQTKQARLERYGLDLDVLYAAEARKGSAASSSVTRSMVKGGGISKASSSPYARPEPKKYSDDPQIQRQTEREVRRLREVEALERAAGISQRKVDTQNWLESQPDPVFYCEVQSGFAGNTSSLRDAIAPGGGTLCYWTNIAGGIAEPPGFPAAGTGVAGPPAGPHLIAGGARIPKVAVAGGANLFFWHAPSGNTGEVVAAMWNFIKANYAGNNILFGDLNTNPGQLMAHGVPLGEIAAPVSPTRISGRTLDYALADFGPVLVFRAFDQATPYFRIKRRFGSDHAAMCVRW
jgi:hypothetical protein